MQKARLFSRYGRSTDLERNCALLSRYKREKGVQLAAVAMHAVCSTIAVPLEHSKANEGGDAMNIIR